MRTCFFFMFVLFCFCNWPFKVFLTRTMAWAFVTLIRYSRDAVRLYCCMITVENITNPQENDYFCTEVTSALYITWKNGKSRKQDKLQTRSLVTRRKALIMDVIRAAPTWNITVVLWVWCSENDLKLKELFSLWLQIDSRGPKGRFNKELFMLYFLKIYSFLSIYCLYIVSDIPVGNYVHHSMTVSK